MNDLAIGTIVFIMLVFTVIAGIIFAVGIPILLLIKLGQMLLG